MYYIVLLLSLVPSTPGSEHLAHPHAAGTLERRRREKKVVGSGSSGDEALQGNARQYTETYSVFDGHFDHVIT